MALTIPGSLDEDDDKWLSDPKIASVETPAASPLIETPNKYVDYGVNLQIEEIRRDSMSIPEEESTKDYFAYGQELQKTNVESLKNSLKIASLADADQAAAIQEFDRNGGATSHFKHTSSSVVPDTSHVLALKKVTSFFNGFKSC